MTDYLDEIRNNFNILLSEESLTLTLINPNITEQVMHHIKNHLTLISHLKCIEIVILQCPSFDDKLLAILATGMPRSLKELSLDFTGCESLRGEGFLQLFQKLDGLQLTKLSLDFGSLYDINDIVVEALTLLLSNLEHLEQFYLDIYQVDQISEDGYLLLGQALSQLENLTKFHLDLSANYNLTEDALQIIFGGLSKKLTHFTFKILDTDTIGGGSFFKLAESLKQMTSLRQLCLTISTFSNLNHKGIYSIIRSISKLQNLEKLQLNLSDIDLPQKMITYLTIPSKLTKLALDISCNRRITFGDFLNLGLKIKGLKRIQLNLDFCTSITEDVIEQIVQKIKQQNTCTALLLTDRNYSLQFQNELLTQLIDMKSLLECEISSKTASKKMQSFQQFLHSKRQFLSTAMVSKERGFQPLITRNILQQIFHCN